MSTTETTTAAPANSAMIPRLGSLLAFAPLGVWTTWHLYSNLAAYEGARAWEAAVTAPRAPVMEAITSIVVLLPLALHTAWGIRRLRFAKPNNAKYNTYDNLKYLLQRLSAVGVLLFLIAHIYKARLEPLILHGRHEVFSDIAYQMHHHMPTLLVYLLGTLGVAYHFANGISSGAITWGITASERGIKRMNFVSICAFVVLLAMSWGSIAALYVAGATQMTESRGIDPAAAPAQH